MTATTKIIDTECPGCKKQFGTAIDLNEIGLTMGKVHEDHNHDNKIMEELQDIKKRLDDKPKEAKPNEPVIPMHIAKFTCKACGKLHENKNFRGLPIGKCDTCGEKFHNKSRGKCPFCKDGEVEELSDEDLNEMGMFMPEDESVEIQGVEH